MTDDPRGSDRDRDRDRPEPEPEPEAQGRPAPYVPGTEGGATPPPTDDLSSTGWSDQPPTEPWGGAEETPGQPPYGAPAYPAQGQAEKGYAPQGGPVWTGGAGGPGGPDGPGRRPGTVTAAAWITWVTSGLTALVMALLTVLPLVASGAILDRMRSEPGYADLERELDSVGMGAEQLVDAMWVFGLIGLVWSVAAFVLAVFAFRRHNWARIALVVSASVVALVSLLLILSGISLIPLLAAGATIVLLFVGGANDWYAGRARGGSPQQGQQGPGGPPGAW